MVGWPDPSYSKFKAIHKDREPIVYVGANDGMLHGFSAKDGREVIGYVPAAIFSTGAKSGLHYFTSPDFKHEYLVDGTPAISDVFIRSRVSANQEWRTVLLSTLRGGGRGLFAIDVTDPEKFNESSAKSLVLWEFNNSHDEHLGYTFSKPVLARMNNGRWAAILGNGYEDTATDETGGQAQLFIIYLDGGLDGKWTEGRDYHRLTTGVGSPGKRNGLASPAVVDLDGDAHADRVYAGDLEGNMWVFDLSSRIPSEWRVKGEGISRPMPLFRATDSAGNPQPITVEPQVIRQQKFPPSSPPNLMVFFGTGQYMYEADKSTKEPQTFYGVWDRGDLNLTRENLVAQKILLETQSAEGKGRVTDPDLEVDYFWIKRKDYGWFLDLPTQGERVVGDPKVRYDTVYFNTLIPDPQSCGFGGTGWMMSVVTFNGGSPPEETPAFDFNEDGIISSAGDTVEFRDERYAYAGKKFEKGGEPTGPSIAATGGNHMRYTVGTETDEAEEVEANLLEKKKGVNGRISWNQLYPVYEPPKQ